MATFSALFFSDLPGQRQIAFFSIVGIIASLAFSLLVLPHFIRGLPPARFPIKTGMPARGRAYRVLIHRRLAASPGPWFMAGEPGDF